MFFEVVRRMVEEERSQIFILRGGENSLGGQIQSGHFPISVIFLDSRNTNEEEGTIPEPVFSIVTREKSRGRNDPVKWE